MTHTKKINTWMEYDEGDVSIRLHDAFDEIKQVAWDEKFILTIGRDGKDLVITISLPNTASTGQEPRCPACGGYLLEDDRVWSCVNPECGSCR